MCKSPCHRNFSRCTYHIEISTRYKKLRVIVVFHQCVASYALGLADIGVERTTIDIIVVPTGRANRGTECRGHPFRYRGSGGRRESSNLVLAYPHQSLALEPFVRLNGAPEGVEAI
ncbi:hypothetical protein KPH14_011153 [Odynerus spinipes]|uniref:Uncharacterized protein n=1 Tax=Odynerus spinipes TaxID=1348599 RepID=A0AAD9RFY2_9HYME|nr:hypothetical protein KPH14_011153 [Odynerus spinipes]